MQPGICAHGTRPDTVLAPAETLVRRATVAESFLQPYEPDPPRLSTPCLQHIASSAAMRPSLASLHDSTHKPDAQCGHDLISTRPSTGMEMFVHRQGLEQASP